MTGTRAHFLEPLLRPGDVAHRLVIERNGLAIAEVLELAADSRTRNKGLLGRSGMAEGSAMIIAPCSAIHTFFMRFTIDVVFVDRRGLVLRACSEVRPWRIAASFGAFAAVELPGGSVARAGLLPGDQLSVERIQK